MDIEIAKEILKGIDIKFFLNGMTEQSNYIVDKADEINIAIDTVLSELEKKDRIIELMAKEIEFRTGNCPYGTYNYDLDCKKRCNNNYKECWIKYFTKKVEDK